MDKDSATAEQNSQDINLLFTSTGALLTGHFQLTSGLHSRQYLQCALVLQDPRNAERIGKLLADEFNGIAVDVVAAPAIGGILVAHETARALGVRALFAERESGVMTLRRGFKIAAGERVLVVEDVVTTGGSTRETMDAVTRAGGIVVGAGSLVDRSGRDVDLGVPRRALLTLCVPAYDPADCPICHEGEPLVKPGSRAARP